MKAIAVHQVSRRVKGVREVFVPGDEFECSREEFEELESMGAVKEAEKPAAAKKAAPKKAAPKKAAAEESKAESKTDDSKPEDDDPVG